MSGDFHSLVHDLNFDIDFNSDWQDENTDALREHEDDNISSPPIQQALIV
ncbi:hypothetical protein PAXRUDRAFT_22377 [Paxillus rubicundulus Ve08.2h10]|uniref:Uncharacterized protein n=1 Tax=Paxillus rubicundulus Ve08.2h10 TaxID=930991 RepID=A0A0D0C8Z9_9AGAM|nr:hypothetical protein PAXRUDRAFT_22377 [Paxillus rubicundulus Ve08.2h10]